MNSIARIARDWATLAAIFAVGALTGVITWAATSPSPPPPPCKTGRVTLTCPFKSPVMNSRYQDQPVVRLTNGSPEWGVRP